MAYGDFPERANDASSLLLPRGVILGGKLDAVQDVDLKDPQQIQEFVSHSWYKYADESRGLHPFDGVTEPNFTLGPKTKGTKTRIEAVDEEMKYSFVKAPRWKGNAVEVGPLARMVIAYAKGDPGVKELIDRTLKTLDVPITALFSTLGRTAARGLECLWAARKLRYMTDKLIANIKAGDSATANTDKWDPKILASIRARSWVLRGAARRARALDNDRGRQDRELPVRGPHDLEREPP